MSEAIGQDERIRSGLLRKALKQEDAVVTDVMTRAAAIMGEGVANVVNLLDPDMVILGGGLIEACGKYIMPTILEHAERRMMAGSAGLGAIVESALGDDAGVMGAAAMALDAHARGRPAGPAAYVPQVEWIDLGEVQINGQRHTQDVVIRTDGTIKKRRRTLSRRVYGNPHVVSVEEVRHVCKGNPRALIVGTGTEGRLNLGSDARTWLDSQGIKVIDNQSPLAVHEYRMARGPRALLLHLRD